MEPHRHRTRAGGPIDGRSTDIHPSDRGEAYVCVMRDLAEAMYDPALHERHMEELDRIVLPFGQMNAEDLTLVLNGIHDALQELLNELVVGPYPGRLRDTLGIFGDPQ